MRQPRWMHHASFDSLFSLAWALLYLTIWIRPSWLGGAESAQLYASLIQFEYCMAFIGLFLYLGGKATGGCLLPIGIIMLGMAVGFCLNYRSWEFVVLTAFILFRHVRNLLPAPGADVERARRLHWIQFGIVLGSLLLALLPIYPDAGLRGVDFPLVRSTRSDWSGKQFIVAGFLYHAILAAALGPLEHFWRSRM